MFYHDTAGRIYSDKKPAYNYLYNIQYVKPQYRYGGIFKLNYPLNKTHHLIAGIDSTQSEYEERTVYQTTTQRVNSHGKQTRSGLFAEDRVKLLDDKLVATIALRWDSWKTYDGMFTNNSPATLIKYASTDGSITSPKIGAVYHLNDRTDLRSSIGSGINLPTIPRLYSVRPEAVSTYGNPDLKPEKLVAYELGADHRFNDQLSASLVSYMVFVEDYIGTRTISPTAKQRDNLSEVNISGLEPEVKYQINDTWTAAVGYAFNKSIITKDLSTPSAKNNNLTWVPRRKGIWRLHYNNQDIGNANLTAYYMGRQYEDIANTIRLDEYWTISLNFTRQFGDNFTLNLGIDNIFNQIYDVPAGTDPPTEAPGRLITLGLKAEF